MAETDNDIRLEDLLREQIHEGASDLILKTGGLPAVRSGDKRIILIDGEPAGAVNRVPPKGEARANMHVGAKPEKSSLTDQDQAISAAIGPTLREKGLLFVGIDVIGGKLTEINVTSPTGIQEIDRFDGVCLEAKVWDAIERRHAATRGKK